MDNSELIAFLKNENIRMISSKMPAFKNKNIDVKKLSDFDVFNALCENIYLFSGHPYRYHFLNLLSECASCDISSTALYNVEYRKKLWQRIFFDSNIVLPHSKIAITKNVSGEALENFYLNSAIDCTFDDIYSLLDSVLKRIKSCAAKKLYFDARNINFIRPDDFHAQRSYNELKESENDSSLLSLWLLCRILMNTELKLDLTVENTKKAEDILVLISRLGLSPEITLGFDIVNYRDYNAIYELLIKYSEKNISLELICTKEDTDLFLSFLSVVPLVFIKRVKIAAGKLETALGSLISAEEIELIISYLNTVE